MMIKKSNKKWGSPRSFPRHNADKYGYLRLFDKNRAQPKTETKRRDSCSTVKEFSNINSRKNFDDPYSVYTLVQLHDSERLHSSKTLVQRSFLRSRDEFSRHNDAIIS